MENKVGLTKYIWADIAEPDLTKSSVWIEHCTYLLEVYSGPKMIKKIIK